MSVDDLVEAYLAGKAPTVPSELKEEFERALAGHKALERALAETTPAQPRPADERGIPALPEDYEVVREIGRGGMGVVYLAKQRSLGRMVAVKVLRPGEIAFGPLVRRFVEEARHLARLRHPNIVSVHETGQAGDEPYFTMDYVEGESLHAMLKRGPLSPTQAVRILKQAAEGVEHAHAQGIIHRDLKPANILIDKAGRAYVTDFGLARDVKKSSELTGSGDVLGTPAYMAPEQAQGKGDQIGERTDVHALGVLLYETMTGVAPYGHGAPADVLVRLLKEDPAPPRKLDRRIPRDLETICLKAMAKAPEARYASVTAFLEDLRRYESGDPIRARRPSPLRHVLRFAAAHWRIAVAAAIAATAMGVFAHRHFATLEFENKWNMAETLHGTGDHIGAVRSYHSLYLAAPQEKREAVLAQMVRCAGDLGATDDALDAWGRVLGIAPDRSFGALDRAVVRVLLEDLKRRHVYLAQAAKDDPKAAGRALARLNILLAGTTGTAEEREEAAKDHDVLEGILHPDAPKLVAKGANDNAAVGKMVEQVVQEGAMPLLAGTEKEREQAELLLGGRSDGQLARTADNEEYPVWDRGLAAFALAHRLEKRGDRDGALGRYRDAWSFIQSGFAFYLPPKEPPSGMSEGQKRNCSLVRELDSSLRRLDPATPERLRGGIVLHFEGHALPRGWTPRVELTLLSSANPYPLTDPGVPDKGGGKHSMSTFPGVDVSPGSDGSVRVGIADGRYRLTVKEDALKKEENAASIYHALVLDDLPKEVNVYGDWVDLPPIRTRALAEIRLLAPEDGAHMDVRRDVFRWTPVDGAAKYEVTLGTAIEGKTATATYSGTESCELDAKSPLLCLAELKRNEFKGNRENFESPRSGEWSVAAFDASDHLIGISGPSRRMYIEHGLDPIDEAAEKAAQLQEEKERRQMESHFTDLLAGDGVAREKEQRLCAKRFDYLVAMLKTDNGDWDKGHWAFAAARVLEERGDRDGALARYREAWDLLRSGCPVCSCPEGGQDAECRFLRETEASLRRLDPKTPDRLRGGIVLHVEGSGAPRGWKARIRVSVRDAADPGKGLRPEYGQVDPRLDAWIGPGGEARFGVADGRYVLGLCEEGRPNIKVATEDPAFPHELAFDGVPEVVEVKAGWVDLPPVRLRLLKDVPLVSPAESAHVDLRHEVLRWGAVEGAAKYRLRIGEGWMRRWIGRRWVSLDPTVEVSSPSVCLGEIDASKLTGERARLATGWHVTWSVEALDESGQAIGVSAAPRLLILEHGLEEK